MVRHATWCGAQLESPSPVHLIRSDGAAFELVIAGYEFPHEHAAEYDSNWLNVAINVKEPRGSWRAVDPALLTYEVARLAEWLGDVASGRPTTREIGFMEPNLALELRGEPSTELRIILRLDFRPAWWEPRAGEDEYHLDFPIDSVALRAAANGLQAQLSRFPQRAPR